MNEHTERDRTNWNVDYEGIEPIRIRDPAAEALAVLEPGEPFVIDYADVVKTAGHSCPTAAGAFRMTQLGLRKLYPSDLPRRGEIDVTVGGPRSHPTYGVVSRIVSSLTGAAQEDGFGGLAGGHGGRKHRLHFEEETGTDEGPTVTFERTDTGDAVVVTYHVGDLPDAGPATRHLGSLIDGTATPEERAAFADAWHDHVRTVLTDDDLFDVSTSDA